MGLRISVVIPTRDTRDLTLAALASLSEQSRVADEIVVVDDGGEDGTLEAIAATFPETRCLRLDVSVGFAGAVNRGVRASSGDVIWLLNSDTVVGPGAVATLVSSFETDPSLGIAGPLLRYPNGETQWSGGRFPGPLWLLGQASGLPALLGRVPMWRRMKPVSGTSWHDVDWVTGAAMAVRRDAWKSAGPLQEAYRFYCQDLDLCWRATTHGWTVRVLRDVRVFHAHGSTIRLVERAQSPINPEYLWPDLVLFFRLNHGERSATLARTMLILGGWARVLARRLRDPFVKSAERATWREGTRVYRGALNQLGL